MQRTKRETRKQADSGAGMLHRFAPTLLIISAIALTFFTVAGHHGLLQLSRINNEAVALEQKNRRLESEIENTKHSIEQLEHSDFALEKKAREELGLARQGETVYIFKSRGKNARAQLSFPDLDLPETPDVKEESAKRRSAPEQL
jgi:cell division protein FtsB